MITNPIFVNEIVNLWCIVIVSSATICFLLRQFVTKKSMFCQNSGFLRSKLDKIVNSDFPGQNFPVFRQKHCHNFVNFWFLKDKTDKIMISCFSGQNCPVFRCQIVKILVFNDYNLINV